MGIKSVFTPAIENYRENSAEFRVVVVDIEADDKGFDGNVEVLIGPNSRSERVKIPTYSMLRYRFKPEAQGQLAVIVRADNRKGEAVLNL